MVVQFQPRLLINGKLVEASDKKTFPVHNPATREKVIDVPEASEDDANAAVAAAKAAFPAWSKLSGAERAGYLKKLAALLRQNSDELAMLDAVSMGKPISTFTDAVRSAAAMETLAGEWIHLQGQSTIANPGYLGLTIRQPFGVAAIIIPWNHPITFMVSKAAAALMAGNTVVLKSSEKAPLTPCRAAELIQEAGFPPGVFNILSGHGTPSGAVLAAHMDVRIISFTGSGRTGRIIQQEAAKSNLKKVVLELGGKTPAIIFEDANMKKAVADTCASIRRNSGQVCMANSRLYVQKSIYPTFLEAFKKAFGNFKAGDPMDKETNHGPQADDIQYKTIMSYVEEAKKVGTLEQGGIGKLDTMNGYFIEPTLFTNMPEDARIMKDEVFGPVVIINAFDTEAEVIAKANDSEFGLYGSVFTKNIDRAIRVAKALETGCVGVNCTSPLYLRDLPYGGYKASGQGREGLLNAIQEYLEEKSIAICVDEDEE